MIEQHHFQEYIQKRPILNNKNIKIKKIIKKLRSTDCIYYIYYVLMFLNHYILYIKKSIDFYYNYFLNHISYNFN